MSSEPPALSVADEGAYEHESAHEEQELADRSLPLGTQEDPEASLEDLRHALAGVDRDGVLLVLGRLKAQYDVLESEYTEQQAELEGLRSDLATVHGKYEASMDRAAELRADLRAHEAQLSDLLEMQAQAEAQRSEMARVMEEQERAAHLAARRADECDKALAEAQAALDHERQLTLEAEKAAAKHKQASSAKTEKLRKELAAARREAEKAAKTSTAAMALEGTPASATASSSPASSNTVLPDDSELRAELEAAHISHARLEASLQSSDVQIRALREDNLELKEQCEALQRQLEHRADPFFGRDTPDTSRISHELDMGQISLADETQMGLGLGDRVVPLEEENAQLKDMVAQLKETNGDLTTCMEKMVDQINNQEGYASLKPGGNEQIKVLSSRPSGAGASRPTRTHASKSSIDWGSFLPRLMGSTPSTPVRKTAGDRRVAKREEVEDESDRAEREKVRATMEQYNAASPTRPAPRSTPSSAAQGLGSFFAQLLPSSSPSTPDRPPGPEAGRADRLTAPPTRLAYRPRVRPSPSPPARPPGKYPPQPQLRSQNSPEPISRSRQT